MNNFNWTKNPPQVAEYYWAIHKDEDTLLDCSPEVVKVYFDGKWKVYRPGEDKPCKINDFIFWSDKSINYPTSTKKHLLLKSGWLIRLPNDELVFRIYDKENRKYKDYQLRIHDIEININDSFTTLVEEEIKDENGNKKYDGFIDYV